jgi:hypothetical protein
MRTRDKINHIKKANAILDLRVNLIKEGIDNKYSNKKQIANAILTILKEEKIEGRYTDEHWGAINKLTSVLNKYGIDYDLESANYGHNTEFKTELPNYKVYVFNISVMDKMGKTHILPLRVTCAFVGNTGTMTDGTYELTYYFTI